MSSIPCHIEQKSRSTPQSQIKCVESLRCDTRTALLQAGLQWLQDICHSPPGPPLSPVLIHFYRGIVCDNLAKSCRSEAYRHSRHQLAKRVNNLRQRKLKLVGFSFRGLFVTRTGIRLMEAAVLEVSLGLHPLGTASVPAVSRSRSSPAFTPELCPRERPLLPQLQQQPPLQPGRHNLQGAHASRSVSSVGGFTSSLGSPWVFSKLSHLK